MHNKMTTKYNKGNILTNIGLIVMILLVFTKIVPSSPIAGYSVFVGIAFFFIVEAIDKTQNADSGLRFKSFLSDLKKPWVIFLVLLPVLSAVATLFVGDLIFNGEFSTYVVDRTSPMLSLDKVLLLVFQVVIAAFGEEIAWRGFFLGKSMKTFPFWLCAIVSSILFAAGHIAVGDFGLVFYDIITIFIDSIIFSYIYKKSGNCLISTVSHILGNSTAIIAILFFM